MIQKINIFKSIGSLCHLEPTIAFQHNNIKKNHRCVDIITQYSAAQRHIEGSKTFSSTCLQL